MKIKDIHALAIKLGIQNDFRSESQIKKNLERLNKQYKDLPKKKQDLFDKEQLENPYMDSTVNYDNDIKNVKRVMAGIDIDTSELLVARSIGDIDLVIAHHPTGKALPGLDGVMDLQVDVMHQYGVPVNIAESLTKKRISEVSRGISPINHFKSVDAAQNLDINFMNVHTPADNMVATFLRTEIENAKPEYVSDILDTLLKIPEYREAKRNGSGPRLFVGSEDNRVGKIAFTEITGGTSYSKEMYKVAADAGIGTIISMHQSEENRKAAEKAHVNVVIAGHMSSDSIGMNLFLDELEKKGIEIVPCSGLIRRSRV